ncbi:hypothetical protein GRF29_161g1142261 [Pseudopithomyces chartarum]|uniref:Zn(2)-C6 fungal-type domain-containing protein n=1 Tax=Pseudopithomyces chartarum TaxID=1892770 RepID=A0AAN6REI8_9PLEO|nr:hypothetical protein GRF29_161g1142261 [Pseudopithomyces chartarum]
MVVTRAKRVSTHGPTPCISVEQEPNSMSSTSGEGKVYKKRPHRKVKSGCQTCKRRKIKCDELKPQCSNCLRYSSQCVYPAPTDSDHGRPSVTPPAHSPGSYSDDYHDGTQDLGMRDLALLHQWSISTCYGFGDDFIDDVMPWRDHLPVLAQQFPFLMRGMLALSALHLAKNATNAHTRVKFLRAAAYHQDLALPEYRCMLLDVTRENAVPVLAFSAMLAIYSFAAPKNPKQMFAEGPPEWIFLHRGVGDIPAHWWSWIDNSILERQMHRRRLQAVDPSLNPEDFRLDCLETLITSLPLDETVEAPAYEGALYWLRQAYAHTYCHESMIGPKYAFLAAETTCYGVSGERDGAGEESVAFLVSDWVRGAYHLGV